MLEEITGVTESGSKGIVAQFTSFRSLMKGFEQLERRKAREKMGQKDVEGMLAGCVVFCPLSCIGRVQLIHFLLGICADNRCRRCETDREGQFKPLLQDGLN